MSNETFVLEEGGFESVPADIYSPCGFHGITRIETKTKDGEAFQWKFEIMEGEHKGRPITALTDTKNPKITRKFGRFLAAIAGINPEKGKPSTPNDYIGHKYAVVVEQKKNGQGVEITSFKKLK